MHRHDAKTPGAVLPRALALMLPLLASAPVAAFDPASAETQALYERYDTLVTDVLDALPALGDERQAGRIAWYATASDAAYLDDLQLSFVDTNGNPLRTFDAPAGDGLQRALGTSNEPGAGSYTLRLRVPDGEGGVEEHEQELLLYGGEAIIEIRVPGEGLRERNPQVTIWGDTGGAGLVTRLMEWFGLGTNAIRLDLDEDPLQAPDVRSAIDACASGDVLVGLRALRAIRAATPEPPAALSLSYARCALRAGLRAEAGAALEAVGKRQVDDHALAETSLAVAELDVARGDDPSAVAVLRALAPVVPLTYMPQYRDKLSLLLLEYDAVDEAAALLAEGRHLSVSEIWGEEGSANPILAFLLLNHGIALARQDELRAAMSVFDLAGQRDTRGPLGEALRDRANLMLGREMLRLRQGSEAAAAFDRIDLDGKLSSAALLGRGWAVLQGPSERIAREDIVGLGDGGLAETALRALHKTGVIGCFELQHFIDGVSACPRSARFERARLDPQETNAPAAAMRYWAPLMERDARDPNVIRAYLAAAEAFALVGRDPRAVALLAEATRRLDAVEARMADARAALEDGALPDFRADPAVARERDLSWWLLDWASGDEPAQLRASADFLAMLSQVARDTPAATHRDALAALRGDLHAAWRADAVERLATLAEEYRELRAAARLAEARIFDRRLGLPAGP